jgi:predicted aspartyl protease
MLSRRSLLAGLPAGLPLLGAAASARAQDAGPAPTNSPPAGSPPGPLVGRFEITTNHPWTAVFLEGQGPFRFLLDTGASTAVIDPDLAARLNLKRLEDVQLRGATAERTVSMFVSDRVVVAERLRQRGAVTFVAGTLAGFDGVLPGALLTGTNTEIDFAAREFRIYGAAQPDRTGFTRLPLVEGPGKSDRGRLVVRVKLDGRPVDLLIDTGGTGSVLLSGEYVGKNKLWDRYPKWTHAEGMGIMNAFQVRLVRARSLQLGPTEFDRPVVNLTDPFNPPGDQGDGVLGMDVLRRFTLSTDPVGKALWVKPNAAVKDPFRYNRAGFEADFTPGAGGVAVTSVQAGTPAARAGLMVGDRLPNITDGRDLAGFDWFLSEGPGTMLEFEVERAGMRFPVKLVLEDLI